MINIIAWIFIFSSIAIAIYVYCNIRRHPEPMKIMNVVWVMTALWGSFGALFFYRKWSRNKPKVAAQSMDGMVMPEVEASHMISDSRSFTMSNSVLMPIGHGAMMDDMPPMNVAPTTPKVDIFSQMPIDVNDDVPKPYAQQGLWRSVVLSTMHCGAGCVLADLVGEGTTYFLPLAIGGSLIAGSWVLDFVLALVFGVFFQYKAMKQMQPLMSWEKLIGKAAKVDVLSLIAWQVGMYGWMAICYFLIYPEDMLTKDSATFWFMMQIAMLAGFCTALPVNYLLIRCGVKKVM